MPVYVMNLLKLHHFQRFESATQTIIILYFARTTVLIYGTIELAAGRIDTMESR